MKHRKFRRAIKLFCMIHSGRYTHLSNLIEPIKKETLNEGSKLRILVNNNV